MREGFVSTIAIGGQSFGLWSNESVEKVTFLKMVWRWWQLQEFSFLVQISSLNLYLHRLPLLELKKYILTPDGNSGHETFSHAETCLA